MLRPVQYFSDDYLQQTRDASTEQILEFLEQFRLMQSSPTQNSAASIQISLKVNENLLRLFRAKCEL